MEKGRPGGQPLRFLRQLPWYAMQIAIVVAVAYAIMQGSKFSPEKDPPNVVMALGIGVLLAMLATGIVAKVLDWLLIARVALSRRLRRRHQLTSQGNGLVSLRPSGNGAQPSRRLRIGQDVR